MNNLHTMQDEIVKVRDRNKGSTEDASADVIYHTFYSLNLPA